MENIATVVFWLLTCLVYGNGYTPPTLRCTNERVPSLQDATVFLDDMMVRGDIVFKINDLKGLDATCEANGVIEVNGTDVVLTQSLEHYCADRLKCVFVCNDAYNVWSVLDIKIRRTQEYRISFGEEIYTTSVQELSPTGTPLHLDQPLTLTLPDCVNGTSFAMNTVFYKLIEGTGNLFEWRAETSPDSLNVNGVIDYERNHTFEMEIQAVIEGIHGHATAHIRVNVIDIDDSNPEFSIAGIDTYHLSIQEENSSCVNVPLATRPPIHAYDPDFGINSTILYSIVRQNDSSLFSIDKLNGSVSVSKELDREAESSYTLVIQATQADRSTATSTAVLMVTVTDIDDNEPVFQPQGYSAEIVEHDITGAYVCAVTAVDIDEGDNAIFKYELFDDSYVFIIDKDGVIRVANSTALDRKYFPNGIVNITVGTETSQGTVGQHNATVTVTLIDVNDNSPQFTDSIYNFDISQVRMDATIGQVHATDTDIGPNGNVTYTLIMETNISSSGGVFAETKHITPFMVEPISGNVVIGDILLCKTYILSVEACDNPTTEANRRCTTASLHIRNHENAEMKPKNTEKTKNVLRVVIAPLVAVVVLILIVTVCYRKNKRKQKALASTHKDLPLRDYKNKTNEETTFDGQKKQDVLDNTAHQDCAKKVVTSTITSIKRDADDQSPRLSYPDTTSPYSSSMNNENTGSLEGSIQTPKPVYDLKEVRFSTEDLDLTSSTFKQLNNDENENLKIDESILQRLSGVRQKSQSSTNQRWCTENADTKRQSMKADHCNEMFVPTNCEYHDQENAKKSATISPDELKLETDTFSNETNLTSESSDLSDEKNYYLDSDKYILPREKDIDFTVHSGSPDGIEPVFV